jgi:RNA polymerase sigma factor (sigma-70 family)
MLPVILAIRDEDDRNFVEQIYVKYGRKIAGIARKYIDNELDVEDCIQDVFVVLIDRLEDFRQLTEVHQKNFLVKCCRCIAINKYKENMKRRSKEVSVDDGNSISIELPDESENIAELIISEENKRRICGIIEEMDPKYGDILYLRGFLGMKNVEIAKMLNISTELVNVRYQRARELILNTKGEAINEIRGK